MKEHLNMSILLLFFTSVCFAVQGTTPHQDQMALTIIIDTSWSCEHDISDFVSLSRQAISSYLNPGDDLEIITAHPGKPKIRGAQTIKTGKPEEIKNITTILRGIRSGFLSNASISKALEMAFERLDKTQSQKKYKHVAVIIFSDGQLSDGDAKRLLDLATKFQNRSWSLYLTGNKDTNKRLLVAANQGKLNWSLIGEANSVVWLQTQRAISTFDAEKETPPEPPQEKEITSTEQATTESLEHHAAEPKKKEDKLEVRTVVDSTVSIAHPSDKTATPDTALPEDQLQEPNEPVPGLIEEIEIEQTEELQEPIAPAEAEPQPKRALGKILLWILLPVAGLLALLGLTLYMGIRNANRWKESVNSHLKQTRRQSPGILIAKLNGQSYRLGPVDRFKAAHIGSGPNNSIRITGDKSIKDRHLRIYRKGNGLWLKNLARSSVIANGTEIKSRCKHRLIVPAVIQLNDKAKLNLELLRQKPITPDNRRENNEPEKQ